jgi:hypothetical protein
MRHHRQAHPERLRFRLARQPALPPLPEPAGQWRLKVCGPICRMRLGASEDIIDCFPPADEVFARLQDRSASVGRGDKQLRKLGSTHPKLGQQSARLNYPATLNSFRRCLKVIDTSLQPTMGREVSRLRCCRLIQRHPASPASSSIRLTGVAPANTHLPDPPTSTVRKPTDVTPRSCRPQ